MNQMRDDFGVGIRDEAIAGKRKPCAYLFVIFDDSVVNDRKAILADVRMGVTLGRNAVRSLARMRDAKVAVNPGLIRHLGERSHAPDTAQAMQPVVDYCDPRGVVAAILELAQAFEQDGNDITLSDCANDSAHKDSS